MRLMTTRTYNLVEYYDGQVPPYAILSHTWEIEEIIYQDMQNLPVESRSSKRGWSKIERACEVALMHGFDLLWVDTRCIDKTNSVELSEAINSMFQWYKNSKLCIAHLADVTANFESLEKTTANFANLEASIFSSRWWKRGWTLQELIAPPNLQFYNSMWRGLGSKSAWALVITSRIGIPGEALEGDLSVNVASVAQKFSWAAERQTTRLEDEAYCLLGLFDINMPLLYGEGPKAFRRLQDEIIKQSNDLTILAHSPNESTTNLLAEKPADFKDLGAFRSRDDHRQFELSITKRGLQMIGEVPMFFVDSSRGAEFSATYFIPLGYNTAGDLCALCLSKIGPRLYHRNSTEKIRFFNVSRFGVIGSLIHEASECHILLNGDPSVVRALSGSDRNAIVLSPESIYTSTQSPSSASMLLEDPVPYTSYDRVRRLFFRKRMNYRDDRDPGRDIVIALKGSIMLNLDVPHDGYCIEVVILCYNADQGQDEGQAGEAHAFVFEAAKHPHLQAFLFADVNRESSVVWPLLRIIYPEVRDFSNSVEICRGQKRLRFTASFESHRVRGQSLQVRVEHLSEKSTTSSDTGFT